MKPQTRIVLADDHALILEALRRILEPECAIVGTATDGQSLLRMAVQLAPDAVVLDLAMPGLNGLDACVRLREQLPAVKLVVLTANPDPDVAREAFHRGASAYVVKHSAAAELFTAIRRVLAGGRYLTPLLAKDLPLEIFLAREAPTSPDKLTGRQREVVQLLAEGLTMKEVADRLGVTPRTVAFHKYTIMQRLDLTSSAALVQYAVEHGLVARPPG